jgi:hypothetical protein
MMIFIADMLNLRECVRLYGTSPNKASIFVCPAKEALPNDTFNGSYNGEPINRTYSPTLKCNSASEVSGSSDGGWQLYWASNASEIAQTCKKILKVSNNSVILIESKLYYVNWGNSVYPHDYHRASDTNSYPSGTYSDYLYSAWFPSHHGKCNFLFKEGNVQAFGPKSNRFNTDWQLK